MAKQIKRITTGGNIATPGNPTTTRTIILTQNRRGRLDIGTYMTALKAAENIDYPRRAPLYDVYDDILNDTHLSSVITKRKSAVLNTPIEFKRNGKVDEKIEEQLRSPWFYNFLGDLLDTIQFGNSTFQFYRNGNWLGYDLVPRKHVDPVRKIILRRQTDITGTPFDEFNDLVSIGKSRDMGLLAKAAPWVIYKRNTVGDWAQFSELFGQPLREGTYDGWDVDARAKIIEDLTSLGGSPIIVHPEGTNIKLIESTAKSASSGLYNDFKDSCNSELSKLYLGNTLTTESNKTGTQALGTVHQSGENKIEATDKQFVLNVLNYELTDIFINLGIDTKGGEFAFVVPQNKDLSARIDIDTKLKAMGLPIGDDYLYETYGIPKPINYDELKSAAMIVMPRPPADVKDEDEDNDPDKSAGQKLDERKEAREQKTLKNALKSFFAHASDKGALEW